MKESFYGYAFPDGFYLEYGPRTVRFSKGELHLGTSKKGPSWLPGFFIGNLIGFAALHFLGIRPIQAEELAHRAGWTELLWILGILALLIAALRLLPAGQATLRWHAVEHKVLHALENQDTDLHRASALHPACGSVGVFFMLALLVLSLPWLPMLLAGLLSVGGAYLLHVYLPEKSPLRYPGLFFQRLLVMEPHPEQLAAGLKALQALRD
ncbi:MAG: DUF1385 domain-containing protein [Meiothermus ruber]|nr:DUF1385 domain-containing protein [Meiothermus ruber]